jgi:hypothetical protein
MKGNIGRFTGILLSMRQVIFQNNELNAPEDGINMKLETLQYLSKHKF